MRRQAISLHSILVSIIIFALSEISYAHIDLPAVPPPGILPPVPIPGFPCQASIDSGDIDELRKCCTKHPGKGCLAQNGHCVPTSESGSCDVTSETCATKHCTCCISCDGPRLDSKCKTSGGTCRRTCEEDEYFESGLTCSTRECRCCKKNCNGEETCAGGKGRCMSKTKRCPRGYYASNDRCRGLSCQCCVPCSGSCTCTKRGGFCEGQEKKCPLGYREDNCSCRQNECKCCSQRCSRSSLRKSPREKRSITMVFNLDGSAGNKEEDSEREWYDEMGQEALAHEVEEMENEEM